MIEANSLKKELKAILSWHQARITLLTQFIFAIVKVRSVNLTQVAQAFSGTAKADSNYKRLQRFLNSFEIDYDVCATLIAKLFCPSEPWRLSLDRTNWAFGRLEINFLVLAVEWNGIAIPILWRLLAKKGNSNTGERKELLDHFLRLFGVGKIAILTADREFRGKKWFQYLIDHHIPFCIRIPNNTKVWNKHKNRELPVSRLFSLKKNEKMTLNGQRKIWGISVYLSCVKGAERVIVASSTPDSAIENYARRWVIETLFGCLKKRGFDLETSHLVHLERLSKLFFVVTLAFGFCMKLGEWENSKKPIKIKKHGRPAMSIFRLGLDILRVFLFNLSPDFRRVRQIMKVLSCT